MKRIVSQLLLVCGLLSLAPFPAESYTISFTPRLEISEEYTDNVDLTAENEEHDFITRIAPGFDLGVTAQQASLSLIYEPSYSLYSRQSESNAWSHSITLAGQYDVTSRLRFNVRDALLRTEDPRPRVEDGGAAAPPPTPTDPQLPVDTTVRRGRNTYLSNSSGARVTYQLGPDSSMYADYAYETLDNDDDTLEDNRRNIPSAGITYWFAVDWGFDLSTRYTDATYSGGGDSLDRQILEPVARLTRRFSRTLDGYVQYAHTMVTFDDRGEAAAPAADETAESDFHVYEPSVGVIYLPSQDLDIRVQAGLFHQDRDDGDTATGFSLLSSLMKRYQSGTIGLALETGKDLDYFGSEDLGFTQYYTGRVTGTYNFTPQFYGDIYAGYRFSDYLDSEPNREDQTTTTGLGVNYRVLPWMLFRCAYDFSNNSSTESESEYMENRAMLTVTLAPANPYQWVH